MARNKKRAWKGAGHQRVIKAAVVTQESSTPENPVVLDTDSEDEEEKQMKTLRTLTIPMRINNVTRDVPLTT